MQSPPLLRWRAVTLACGLFLIGFHAPSAPAQNRTLVIGDSGSEEYAVEFFFSAPTNAGGTTARNWVELLAQNRSSDFSFGSYRAPFGFSIWPDYRTWGYEYNFSFPGDETTDAAGYLQATFLDEPESWLAIQTMNGLLQNQIDQVVVFLGANDSRSYYDGVYFENNSDENAFRNQVLTNLGIIVDHIQSQNASLPIVVVNIPDVGATPDEQSDHPDQARRQIYSRWLKTLNDDIASLASSKGIGVADVYGFSREIVNGNPIYIGGVAHTPLGHPDNDPFHLFAKDSFHPNTPAQGLYAQAIVDGINDRYGQNIPKISGADILAWQGLTPPTPPYNQYIPVFGWETVIDATERATAQFGPLFLADPADEQLAWSTRWHSWLSADLYENAVYSHHHGWLFLSAPSIYWAYTERLGWAYAEDSYNGWIYAADRGWYWTANSSTGIYWSPTDQWVYFARDGSVFSFGLGVWL